MPRAVEPMGLLYVAGAFKKMNVQVDLVDLQLGYGDLEAAYERVARQEYDGVGIALASQACLWSALKIAQDLANLCPTTPLFTGGIFASLNADWLLSTAPAFDFVVIGEAEPFVVDFVTCEGKWEGLPGAWHPARGESRACLPTRILAGPQVAPDRSLTRMVIERGESPSVVASRGCGGGCTFCCISRYYGSRWRPRDVQDVGQELQELVERFGTRRFYLVDDNLFGHTREAREWIKSFVEMLSRFDPSLSFKTTCRLDDLDEALLPDIKRAGFDLLKIGVETFSKESQRVYKKPISREDACRKLDRLIEAGVGVSLGFIMFDPYCSVGDLWENLDFLLQYPDCWSRHLLRSRLVAYRGTRIEERLERDSLVTFRSILGSEWRFGDPKVARAYRQFEALLRAEILDLELGLYRYQKSLIETGDSPPRPGELQDFFKECWVELFKLALQDRKLFTSLRKKLDRLREDVRAFCQEGHFPVAL